MGLLPYVLLPDAGQFGVSRFGWPDTIRVTAVETQT